MAPKQFVLPSTIVGVSDVTRMRHELEKLHDFLTQARMRQPGTTVKLPRVSNRLEELAKMADLTLTKTEDCEALVTQLEQISKQSPQIKISFATDPSEAFLNKIVDWFRANIHPLVLVNVGLQPGIAAGLIIRTPNRYFDLGLRKHFADNKQQLIDGLHNVRAANER